MKDIQQLIKKNSQEGRYEDIFPKTFTDAVEDRESGNNLNEILSGFNMYFLSYNGSRELTRLQVPLSLRKTGLWITYVLYDKTVVTEWYTGEAIDDDSWKSPDNWRVGSNMLVGDISISSDGYWVVNGVVTTTKAQGEQGITPMLRVGSNNHLQVSYTNGSSWVDVSTNPVYTQFRVLNNKLQQSTDLGNTYTYISEELAYKFQESGNKLQMSKDLGNTWEDVSDYIAAWFKFTGTTGSSQADNVGKIQISRDNGVTWSDLSGEFTNSLHIKGYVATVGALPSSAVQGDIYGVGPTYDPSDTGQTNPIYQLYVKDSTGWVNNGKFTSIAAGVVQTTGTSTTEVMSQDAVSKEFASVRSDLGQYYDEEEYIRVYTDNDGKVLFGIKSDGSINWSKGIPFPIQKELIDISQKIKNNEISIENAYVLLENAYVILDYYKEELANEFIYSIKDSADKVIFGIKSDGSVFQKNSIGAMPNHVIKESISKLDLLKTYLFEHMMMSGTHISPVENMTTIPCGFDVDKDGNVYLAIEAANNSTGEMNAAEFITELIIFNLADPEKTKQSYVIYQNNEGYFTYSGQQYYNTTPHEGIVKLFGNSARVLTSIWEHNTEGLWLMWRDFDITTKEVGAYQPCTVDINGVVYEMIKPNAQSIVNAMGNEIFPWTQGGTDYREPDIYLFTDAVLINGWYYCAINIGSGGHVLLKSQDLKAWVFVSDIPIGYYSEEVVLITDKTNRYIYAISRGRNNYYPSTSGDAKILKYDITTNSWGAKKATLNGSRGDRPTMAYKDGYIYAFVGIPALQKRVDGYTISRNGKRMYVLDTNLNILKYYDFTCQFGCESPMLTNIHGNLFMFMCCDPRGYFATEYGSEGRSGIIFSYIDNRMFNL